MSTGTLEKPANNGTPPAETQPKRELTPFEKTRNWLQSESFAAAVGKALPKHMTADRFCRIAITAMMKTPKLAQCTQESIFNCLLQLSQFGLEPDGRNAHLIPFDVKSKGEYVRTDCTLIIDFKGYVDLIMRTGLVANIHADVVCENDEFVYDRGQITKHLIDFRKPRGNAYAAYAVIRFKDGTEKCEVMPKEDILAIRNRSSGWYAFTKGWAKQSPWNPEEPVIEKEMWKKTVFRRVTKWVQLSSELRDVIAKEDEENVRLLDLQDTKLIETSGRTLTKSDALADMMRERQQAADDEGQSEDAPTGEESQDVPGAGEEPQTAEPSEQQKLITRLRADIPIAAPERFDMLHAAIETVKDDVIRAELHGLLKARRDKLSGKKSDGTLPGTK